MATSFTGTCDYVNTLGPTLVDRAAFDGSMPYTITTAAYLTWINTGSSATTVETRFCLNGSPGHYSWGLVNPFPSAMRSALTRQCGIRLRDMYVALPQNASDVSVDIYVGDPSESAPAVSALNTHLSFHNFGGSSIKIPDMDGIVVAAGLNVLVSIKMKIPSSSPEELVVFHSVCDIDD